MGQEATPGKSRGGRLRRLVTLPRHWDVTAMVLLAVIFVVRLLWVLLVAPPALEGDTLFYDTAARWFMHSGTFAISDALQPSAWVMPGYTLFLGVVYWVFGTGAHLLAVRIAQVVLSVLTVWVFYRAALRLRGRRLGIAVIVLFGLYPPFTLGNNYIVTEILYTFLLGLLVLFGVRLLDKASWTNACLFGVLLALAAYVRPAGVIWGVVPFLFLLGKVRFRRVVALAAVGLAAFCLCLSPWWIRNAVVYDRFVAFNTSSSDTLLAGTYVMYGNGEETVPKDVLAWTSADMQRITAQQELEAGARYKQLAMSRLKDQLRNHPGKLILGRLNATAGSFRAPYFWPDTSVPIKKAAKWAQFLLILLPAALALWMLRKDRRALLMASLPIVVGITYALILISPRYVYPLMPAVVFMAAAGWLQCLEWASALLRRRKGPDEPAVS